MKLHDLKIILAVLTNSQLVWLDDSTQLALGDGTEICLEYDHDGNELYFYCCIADIPRESLRSYAIVLMEANLFGRDTGGSAVLAYDSDAGRLVLWDRVPLSGLTQDEFRERFSRLYLASVHWAKKVKSEVLPESSDQQFNNGRSASALGG